MISYIGLEYLLDEEPFKDNLDNILFHERFLYNVGGVEDKKRWVLTVNGSFSVKSYYNFLNDGACAILFQGDSGGAFSLERLIYSIGWCGRIKS